MLSSMRGLLLRRVKSRFWWCWMSWEAAERTLARGIMRLVIPWGWWKERSRASVLNMCYLLESKKHRATTLRVCPARRRALTQSASPAIQSGVLLPSLSGPCTVH